MLILIEEKIPLNKTKVSIQLINALFYCYISKTFTLPPDVFTCRKYVKTSLTNTAKPV